MTLRELSAQYEHSAQLLRVRISELRRRKKMTQDAQELFWLERRMAALAPMLRQMNELAELTAHYYERGYDRNEGYQGPRLTRQEQLARMHRVIENELTEKQRRAVLGYYVDKKTMPELAREFGVCKSTVCRTIQRAERRLRRCLRY